MDWLRSTDASGCSAMCAYRESMNEAGGGASKSPLASAAEPELPAKSSPRKRGRKKREFTKTQEHLIEYIAAKTAECGGVQLTKRELAQVVGRSVGTVDRLMSDLRRRGIIEEEMRFNESGGQVASVYYCAERPTRHGGAV